ncbi:MAG: hypothetical protein GQ527_10220, partial [Bacteroidales bacterium]|nr:hypothetical protein [Bacteroidales bacterium]
MKMKLSFLVMLISSWFISNIYGQDDFKQNISGLVIDEITKEPLIGANIIILGMGSFTGTATN